MQEITPVYSPFNQKHWLLHSKDWLQEEETSTGKSTVMLILFKDFIFQFLVSGSFFSEKEVLNLYTILLVSLSFRWMCWSDQGVNYEANYQGYEYDVYFFQCHTSTVIHSMNVEGVS